MGRSHLKKSDLISKFNHLHIEGYAIFLYIISLFFHFVFIFLVIYLVLLRRRLRIYILLVGIFIVSIFFFSIQTSHHELKIQHHFKIHLIEYRESYQRLTVVYRGKKYHIYQYQDKYQTGDFILIEGMIKEYEINTIPYEFNQKEYYLSEGIYGYIEVNKIDLIIQESNFYSAREKWIRMTNNLQSNQLLLSFLFGENTFDLKEKNLYRELNIYFLLTLSGIHIYTLFYVIKKIAFHFDISKKHRLWIEFLCLLILLYFNTFAYGILRIFLSKGLSLINQKTRLNLGRLDIVHLSFFITLLLDRHLIYSLGFLMLYLIINFITLLSQMIKNLNIYHQRLLMTFIIQLIVIPFQLKFSYLSILLLPFISLLISGPLFILSIFVFLFPKLDPVLFHLYSNMNLSLDFINQKQHLIYLKAMSPYLIIIYFIVLIFVCYSSSVKQIILKSLSIFVVLFIFSIDFIGNTKIYFLDVDQGDSAVIISRKCVAVIDSYMHVSSFLRNHGVKEIDYLILTHHHNDHTKEAMTIIDTFKVHHLVLSLYDDYEMYHLNTIKVKSDDQLICGDIQFDILGPILDYQNPNDNSIVVQFEIHQMKYLFTGDIEKKAELDLVTKYRTKLKSDVLKVPHHGSITSSNVEFIALVNPKYVIVSSGRRNQYTFPNPIVLDRYLKLGSTIYQTEIHGTIQMVYSKKKQKWVVHLSINGNF